MARTCLTFLRRASTVLVLVGVFGMGGVLNMASVLGAGAPPPPLDAAAESLCGMRFDCSETLLFELPSLRARVVRLDLKSEHAPEEVECFRREYWMRSGGLLRLVAVDSATQCGADNIGPASLVLTGEVLSLSYVEYLSSDGCEKVEARISMRTARVLSNRRSEGLFMNQKCGRWRPVKGSAQQPPGGTDGALVVLHR